MHIWFLPIHVRILIAQSCDKDIATILMQQYKQNHYNNTDPTGKIMLTEYYCKSYYSFINYINVISVLNLSSQMQEKPSFLIWHEWHAKIKTA